MPLANRESAESVSADVSSDFANETLTKVGIAMKYMARFGPINTTKYPKVKVPKIDPAQMVEPNHDASSNVMGPVARGVFSGDISTEIAGDSHPTIVP